MLLSLEMKNKKIMNEVCMIFIGIHINMKLKYKKILLRQTAGQNPTKTLDVHSDTHACVEMKNMLLFRILSFPHLACKSGLPLLLLPSCIYIDNPPHMYDRLLQMT